MTSATTPPSGFPQKEVIPASQQQAQDTVLGYLQRTVDALPGGTVLDGTRYGTAGHNSYCDDDDTSPSAPMHYQTIGDLEVPPGTDFVNLVSLAGRAWSSWGWQVVERDGFTKPNQFGYGPDGYRLQIIASAQSGFAPTVEAVSPCFPGTYARDDIPFPPKISSTQ